MCTLDWGAGEVLYTAAHSRDIECLVGSGHCSGRPAGHGTVAVDAAYASPRGFPGPECPSEGAHTQARLGTATLWAVALCHRTMCLEVAALVPGM